MDNEAVAVGGQDSRLAAERAAIQPQVRPVAVGVERPDDVVSWARRARAASSVDASAVRLCKNRPDRLEELVVLVDEDEPRLARIVPRVEERVVPRRDRKVFRKVVERDELAAGVVWVVLHEPRIHVVVAHNCDEDAAGAVASISHAAPPSLQARRACGFQSGATRHDVPRPSARLAQTPRLPCGA